MRKWKYSLRMINNDEEMVINHNGLRAIIAKAETLHAKAKRALLWDGIILALYIIILAVVVYKTRNK